MCFTGEWLLAIAIWAIVIGAGIAIIKLLLPHILQHVGLAGGLVAKIIEIVLWALVLIAICYFTYDLFSCLLTKLPSLPTRR